MSAEMTRRNFVGAAAASAAIALAACAGGETAPEPAPEGEPEATVENPADLVLKNAAVYTVDDNWTVASAVAVKGDTIMAVGSDDDMAAYIGPDTEVKDLGGMMLMPGFMVGNVLESEEISAQIPIFGENILRAKDKLKIKRMADKMGVSFSAFLIRLRELKLFDYRPLNEYIADMGING